MLRKIAAIVMVVGGSTLMTQAAVAQYYPPEVVSFAVQNCSGDQWVQKGYLTHADCMTAYEQSYPNEPFDQ